jgi:hypothetical protein
MSTETIHPPELVLTEADDGTVTVRCPQCGEEWEATSAVVALLRHSCAPSVEEAPLAPRVDQLERDIEQLEIFADRVGDFGVKLALAGCRIANAWGGPILRVEAVEEAPSGPETTEDGSSAPITHDEGRSAGSDEESPGSEDTKSLHYGLSLGYAVLDEALRLDEELPAPQTGTERARLRSAVRVARDACTFGLEGGETEVETLRRERAEWAKIVRGVGIMLATLVGLPDVPSDERDRLAERVRALLAEPGRTT